MTLREKLIVLRDKAGISQMSLAHQLDVSRQAVSRWESGDTTPSMDKLKALAKIYGVSLDWLCSDKCEFSENTEIVHNGHDSVLQHQIRVLHLPTKHRVLVVQRVLLVPHRGVRKHLEGIVRGNVYESAD